MNKITFNLSSKLTRGFMLLFLSCMTLFASAQWTYNATYYPDAGNPGGLNSDGDATSTGWNQVITGPQSANIWSGTIFLPFSFDLYGQTMSTCYASQNGIVTFSSSATTGTPPSVNTNLPSTSLPDSSIAFWDEFTASAPTGTGDNVVTQTFGTAPNRQFWIKWYSFEIGNPTISFYYFAIVLEETTNKIYMVDQYGLSASTSTVGIQLDNSIAYQYGDSLESFQSNGSGIADNDYYEFIPELLVADNAGVSSFDSPVFPLLSGLQNVDVSLTNFGLNDLNSVNIDWEVNGVAQTGVTWTAGPLASLQIETALNIGSYNFPNGFTDLKAWTSLPNGLADSDVTNDTISLTVCTALAGVYSVGGVGADFVDIASAVDGLNNCGVSSAVTFNVAPGTYTGGYILGDIIGSSATNTITFDGGSAATTTLTHDATGIEAVWSFQGADYVTLKNMTITNTGTTDAWGVHLQNASNFNTVDNCIFNMNPTPNLIDVIAICASGDLTNDFSEEDNCNWCTFSNNQINYGEYGMHFEGKSTSTNSVDEWMSGISITNNVFDFIDDYGIYLDNQDSITITGNTIKNLVSTGADGIYSFDIQNFDISGNNITANDYGIYVSDGNFDASVTTKSLISNNMIIAPADYGMYLDDISDLNIYHNTSSGKPAIYVNDISNSSIKNNIFTSIDDYCFESLDVLSGSGTDVDYNMYWTPSSNTFFVKEGASTTTNVYADLTAWQTAIATSNVNSLELEPAFFSPTDLHMTLANGNDAGDNSVGILTDIDGETRPQAPATAVDMGADEWTPSINDAGISAFTNPFIPLSTGLQNVDVTLENYGLADLNSVNVEWTINGAAQTTLNWTAGPLAPFNNLTALNIGSYNFPLGFTTLKAWTTMPNGVTDQEFLNDTTEVVLCTALNGAYFVGGATPDFATVGEAVDALNNCGVSGPVYISIAPGTYNGGYVLNKILGVSAFNNVVFDGGDATTTTLTHDGTGIEAVWSFQGADYITLTNMTIENTGTTDAWGVHLKDTSDYNTVDNCIFNMYNVSGLFDVAAIVASGDLTNDATEGDNANYCTFSNNQINGGEYGFHFEGQSTTTTATNEWMKGMSILNNVFDNVDDYHIYADNQDGISIIGNVIANAQAATSDGIYLYDAMNYTITSNVINSNDAGIYVSDGNYDATVTSQSVISNNMITSPDNYGVYLYRSNNVDVYHNTIVAEPALQLSLFEDGSVKNNILVSSGDYCFENGQTTSTTVDIDYNMYWTPVGATLFIKDGSATYTDLTTWQTASPTLNLNSIQDEAMFSSPTDLHLVGVVGNDVGDNAVGITTDIDGDARPIAPSTVVDMGADEFTPVTKEISFISIISPGGITCGDSTLSVSVEVQNLGLDSITSLPITLIVGGDLMDTINFVYTDTIYFGGTDTIEVATLNTYAGGNFTLEVFHTLAGDANTSNDSLAVTSYTFTPVEPSGYDAVVCGLDSAVLAADTTYTNSFDWYDAPTGGNLVASATTFTVPSIAAQNTYYLEYGSFSETIETIYASNNGCSSGNMFDLVSSVPTTINGFCVNSTDANISANVYYIIGDSYVGNETTIGAWTNAGSYTFPGNGQDNASCFNLNAPIVVPAGQTVAIYIDYNARYTDLATTYTSPSGAVTISTGVGFCTSFSGPIASRTFNGSVTLGVAPCSATRVPVSATNAGDIDLGSDTAVCGTGTSIDLDAGTNGTSQVLWSNGLTTDVISVTTSGEYHVEVTNTAAGCVSRDTINVEFDTTSVDLGADFAICSGSSTTLDAGTAASYMWSTGETTQTIMVSVEDEYYVEVTTAAGCVSSDTVYVSEILLPTAGYNSTGTASDFEWTFTHTSTDADSIMLDLGDGNVSFDVNTTHTYASTGTYEVCAYAFNTCAIDTFCTDITITGVGIRNVSDNIKFSLYPNPTSENLALAINLENEDELTVQIISMIGTTIYSETLTNNGTTNYTKVLDVTSLAQGTYLVKVTGKDGFVVKNFVKK